MKESFDQHAGHRPRPSTGSRQAGQSGGKARSSVVRNTARSRVRGAFDLRGQSDADRQCHDATLPLYEENVIADANADVPPRRRGTRRIMA